MPNKLNNLNSTENIKIGVIGLGYVGLPLAHLFASKYMVIGYDYNKNRIAALNEANDVTHELTKAQLESVLVKENRIESKSNHGLWFTANPADLQDCNYYLVTVPTPVDINKKPNLESLLEASKTIGKMLKQGDTVIYESTVYPGVTEKECVPVLEKSSGLQFNTDFTVGYSPERINPGDKTHTIDKVKKVTSGSTPEAAERVDKLYASVVTAGTHMAPSIQVAEAAKVIENSQRDINIAFVNELAKIFNLMDIDTRAVIEAAATKWNFLPFQPGLVGGHCIGVDPYYLATCAQAHGYHPEIILAGRRLNDSMGIYVATEVIKLMSQRNIKINDASILVLGITFKENCADVRNTKVVDVIKHFTEFGTNVTICDPWANPADVEIEYGYKVQNELPQEAFDAVVLAVAHRQFEDINWSPFLNKNGILYDVKGVARNRADKTL